ncbi:MAG: hypothetical protein IJA65_03670, partial [Acholeplasmatales bacterium]|nr:hypothetical protein [Acholeplasmatales bacterium]
NSFQATFTPKNTNYLPITVSLSVKVEKKELTINVTNNTFTYDGLAHTIAYTVTGMVNGDAAPSVDGNVSKTDAGTYAATLSITNANYKAESVSTSLVINKAKVVAPTQFTATYGDTLGSITLPTSEYGTWSFVDEISTMVGNVGTHTFGIEFTSENNNYESYSTTVNVVVNKKLLVFENVQSSYKYDGTDKQVIYVLNGFVDSLTTNDITVIGNSTQNIVGSKELVLTVVSDNYYSEPYAVKLEVTKGTPSVEFTENYEVEWYSGITLSDLSTPTNFAWRDGTVVLEIGDNQKFEVIYTDVNPNYEQVIGQFTVSVKKVTPVIIYNGNNSSTYDGTTFNLDSYFEHNNIDLETVFTIKYYLLVEDEYQEVTSIHNAGQYKVIASLTESTHYNEISLEINYIVEKKAAVTDPIEDRNAIYGQTLEDLADFPEVADGVWSWEDKTQLVGNVGENYFTAIYTPNDQNITPSSQLVKVIVSPKVITFNNVVSTFDYDGSEHTVSYILSENPDGISVITTGTISLTDYVEGGKEFTLTITGNANYTGSYTGTIVINKINPNLGTVPTFEATYGNTYESIAMPAHDDGVWSLVNTGTITQTGNQIVDIKFTPYSSNYNEITTTTIMVVNKADSVISHTLPSEFEFDGSDKNIVSYFTLNHNESSLLFNDELSVEVKNAGNYTVIVSVNETMNYNSASITINFVINPAEYTPSVNPSGLTATYGEQLSSVALTNDGSNIEGIWSWNQTGTVGNAGTNSFQATFTPNDTNYAPSIHTLSVEVEKATVVINVTNNTFTYDGSAHTIAYTV